MRRELFKKEISRLVAENQNGNPLDLRVEKSPYSPANKEIFRVSELDEAFDYVKDCTGEWFVDIYENIWLGKQGHAEYTGATLWSDKLEKLLNQRPMTASEKFDARLKELGIYDNWCQQGCVGRVGAKTDKGISILVHEDNDDRYTEFTYPPISEMQKHDSFRIKALNEFYVNFDFDEDFARKMIRWVANPNNECPLFPVDVYFLWNEYQWSDFEDDENASVAEYIFAKETEKEEPEPLEEIQMSVRN